MCSLTKNAMEKVKKNRIVFLLILLIGFTGLLSSCGPTYVRGDYGYRRPYYPRPYYGRPYYSVPPPPPVVVVPRYSYSYPRYHKRYYNGYPRRW